MVTLASPENVGRDLLTITANANVGAALPMALRRNSGNVHITDMRKKQTMKAAVLAIEAAALSLAQTQQPFLRQPCKAVLEDPSIIAYWPMSQPGNLTFDCLHQHDGTMYGNNTPAQTGKTGPVTAWMNKSNHNYLGIASITLPAAFSVNVWVKPGLLVSGYARVAEMLYSTGLYLGTDTTLAQWQLIINDATLAKACKGGTVTQGGTTWTMLTAVWDGTYGWLYANGSLIIGGTSACQFTPPTTGLTNSLRIGCYNSGTNCSSINSAWDGGITDFRIYSRALQASDVANLYAALNH